MNFRQRLKQDKAFRWKIILIFIAIVLIISNSGEKKEARQTQEVCNQYNPPYSSCTWNYLDGKCMPGIGVPNTEDECEALLCYVGRQEVLLGDNYGCFSCVPTGLKAKLEEACCTTKANYLEYKNGYNYVCRELYSGETPTPSCTSLERSIGSVLDSTGFFGGTHCKTKFYIVAFGGGLIAFLLIMASL